MKKFIILSSLLSVGTLGANAMDFALPPSVGGLQNVEYQNRLMEQQRFRQEEINDYKELKPQKEAKNKKIELEQKMNRPAQKSVPNNTQNVNYFIENGQLKIKPIQ